MAVRTASSYVVEHVVVDGTETQVLRSESVTIKRRAERVLVQWVRELRNGGHTVTGNAGLGTYSIDGGSGQVRIRSVDAAQTAEADAAREAFVAELAVEPIKALYALAKDYGVKNASKSPKAELIQRIAQAAYPA